MSKQNLLNASALAALCALAVFSLHAKAADQVSQKDQEGQEGREGMVVVRDAQTGKMRAPTPEELKALRATAPPAAAASAGAPQTPTLTSRRDGARGVRLGGKTMVYEVVTRGADGKLSSECVQGEAAADKALGRPATPSATADHKEHSHEAR